MELGAKATKLRATLQLPALQGLFAGGRVPGPAAIAAAMEPAYGEVAGICRTARDIGAHLIDPTSQRVPMSILLKPEVAGRAAQIPQQLERVFAAAYGGYLTECSHWFAGGRQGKKPDAPNFSNLLAATLAEVMDLRWPRR